MNLFGNVRRVDHSIGKVHINRHRLTAKQKWAFEVVRMYLRSLKTGIVPDYPPEPKGGKFSPWGRKR